MGRYLVGVFNSKKILIPDEYVGIWITYSKNGILKIGKGYNINENIIMQYKGAFIPVNTLNIKSSQGKWSSNNLYQ